MADLALTAAKIGACFPGQAEIYDFVAAATITAGQAVYIVAASGTAGVADANDSGKQQFAGIALNGGGAGQAISVLKCGHVYGYTLSGMNYFDPAYLSDTAGKLADANGTMTVNVGKVLPLSDSDLTKVLYIDADWLRVWS